MNVVKIILVLAAVCSGIQALHKNLFSAIESFTNYYGETQILSLFSCSFANRYRDFISYFGKRFHQVNVLWHRNQSFVYPIPANQIIYIVELQNCYDEAIQILNSANLAQFFATPFKWLVISQSLNLEKAQAVLKNLDILVDSDFNILTTNDSSHVQINKIFKRDIHSFDFVVENMAKWNEEEGWVMDKSFEKILYRRRKNLMKTVLNTTIVITNNDSLDHLTDKRDRHIDSIAKVDYVLVQHLATTVNASLKYRFVDSWGYKDNVTGEWNGMIGTLTRKEADIGGTALFLTGDRIEIIEYIAMVTPTRSKFIFRQPKLSYVANVFTLPFDTLVWTSVCGLMAVVAVILYIVIKWEWKKKEFAELQNESNSDEIHDSWIEVTFITFGAFCQQGTSSIPYSLPGRITIIFLFVSFMFLYTSYSANIVALLQSSSTSIRTLADLLHSRLEFGVHDTVFNHYYFSHEEEPVRKAIYKQKVAPAGQKPRFYTIEEGIKRVRKGLFAFHVETGPGYKFISEIFYEHEKCGLENLQYIQVPDPWMAIQKNSSYKKILKMGLLLLQENGIQNREVGLIYTKKPLCLSSGSSFISVGLVDCYPAAVVFGGGIGASIVVFLMEVYVKKRIAYYKNLIRKRHMLKCREITN